MFGINEVILVCGNSNTLLVRYISAKWNILVVRVLLLFIDQLWFFITVFMDKGGRNGVKYVKDWLRNGIYEDVLQYTELSFI